MTSQSPTTILHSLPSRLRLWGLIASAVAVMGIGFSFAAPSHADTGRPACGAGPGWVETHNASDGVACEGPIESPCPRGTSADDLADALAAHILRHECIVCPKGTTWTGVWGGIPLPTLCTTGMTPPPIQDDPHPVGTIPGGTGMTPPPIQDDPHRVAPPQSPAPQCPLCTGPAPATDTNSPGNPLPPCTPGESPERGCTPPTRTAPSPDNPLPPCDPGESPERGCIPPARTP
jgi:hypothetical protein